MIIRPKVRGFVCVTAHPGGCAAHVQEWIGHVKAKGPIKAGPKKVLVIGASTGYGLASRVAAGFGSGAATLGVFFERPSEEGRPATPGWYNSIEFTREARAEGLYASNINGDAFSDEIKRQTLDRIRSDLGQVDLVVYSLASPKRVHPRTGTVHKSVLKPVGRPLHEQDRRHRQGDRQRHHDRAGERPGDLRHGLRHGRRGLGVLDRGPRRGPAARPRGPVGRLLLHRARGHLGHLQERDDRHGEERPRAGGPVDRRAAQASGGGRAFISVNKALVTQASSAIPVVPLYISILYKIMKARGTHEGCIEQMQRLFATQLYSPGGPALDEAGRVRVDDLEMRPEVQDEIKRIWPAVTTENLAARPTSPATGRDFLKLFGFGLPGIDYEAEAEPHVPML